MKNGLATFPFLLLVILLIKAVYDKDHRQPVQTFEVVTQSVSGSNIRPISITSSKRYFDQKQDEVRPRLETMVNGGEYNITSVKTSYSSGYLTAAEITYNASGRGDGNNVRVMLIHSVKRYWDQKAADIKPRLDEVVNSGKYDIVKINTTHERGYMLAAEVYYREKR